MCGVEDLIFRVLKDAASHRRVFQCVSREASAPVQDVDGPVWHLLLCNPHWPKMPMSAVSSNGLFRVLVKQQVRETWLTFLFYLLNSVE
jgi:hypothetical protein